MQNSPSLFPQDDSKGVSFGDLMLGLSKYFHGSLETKLRMAFDAFSYKSPGELTIEELRSLHAQLLKVSGQGEHDKRPKLPGGTLSKFFLL